MSKFKSGFVSIIGKTNVGKSTLLNNLVGEKIAITTPKTQTTRTAIKAIVNRKNAQIIFIDTPGIHTPKNKLGQTMIETTWKTIPDVDILLYIIDTTSKDIRKEDQIILNKLKEKNKKTILIINKIDLIKKESLLKIIDTYKEKYDFSAIIPVSALKNENLQIILDEIEKNLPEGPAYYDKSELTDQTERQLIEEIIREKALKLLDEEIPHGIYVELQKMKKRKTAKDEKIYDVTVTLYCIRESHKGIIIGKNGAMLKKIGMYARQDIERMLDTKVNLKLWVKVKENWQDMTSIVNEFKLK